MNLIINADDFGLDLDRDIGIYVGAKLNLLTSISIIITNNHKLNFRKKLINSIIKNRNISIGLHVNLTDDPLLSFSSSDLYVKHYLYQKNKEIFWRNALKDNLFLKRINIEVESQFIKFEKTYGFKPHHLDFHNHCNIFSSKLEKIFEKIAIKKKIHLRIPDENFKNIDLKYLNHDLYKKIIDKNLINNENINISCICNKFKDYISADMLLYRWLCQENIVIKDNLDFFGTIYGHIHKFKYLYGDVIKRIPNYKDCQLMIHPGFYIPFISHNTSFSNYQRFKELLDLVCLKFFINIRHKNNVKYRIYINYK